MGKRGRPTKEPSAQDRAKVAELLAQDAPITDLAKLFGYSPPTFRKYFRAEILSAKKLSEPAKPTRRITDDMREKVMRYVGTNMPAEDVALLLGYRGEGEYEDFKRDFATELRCAKAAVRAKVVDQLHAQMAAGIVGATNRLEALTQITEEGDTPAHANPGYVGKKAAAKAQANAAAQTGGKFAPRTPPRLVAAGGQLLGSDGESD